MQHRCSIRPLEPHEMAMVAGGLQPGTYFYDTNRNGRYDDGEEIVVVAARASDSSANWSDFSSWWGSDMGLNGISIAGGGVAGVKYGIEATEGVDLAIEAGVIGAEYGVVAGPVGVVIGAGVAVAATYAIHEYGPGLYQDVVDQFQ